MRIVFSTDQVYLHGGIEKVMAEKANYFADVLGYEVFILTAEQKGNVPCYPLSSKINFVDLNVNYHRDKSYFSSINVVKLPTHIVNLRKALIEINPNIVIVCNFSFDYYIMPFLYTKAKKWKEFHSSRFFHDQNRKNTKSFIKQIINKFNDWIETKYDKIILLNPDEKAFYYSQNCVVIPNPIAVTDGVEASLSSNKVLAAGRIAPVKGFEQLIEAWRLVVDKHPSWELHIFGDDYLNTQEKLQSQIIQSNLEKNVFFMGTTDQMSLTMLDYSLYLMTSHTECFPMVLLESLSVGLPIVSFDCPTGPRNIITNHVDGVLVANNNIGEFAQSVCCFIENKELRVNFGKHAKVNSLRFSTPLIMEKWQKLISK
ncbi:glycosyltransferase family 4 protein [Flavobacterium sp. SUN046]|uniref:glycosyltransferase family 4 protein n=1 Tax=Flavobacterium sp. SUN046 TaxID=3002440 RepID=UPI002DB82FF5|nr:glycosyltransferase family 4 protein [Flavobacterium sp. SUN046]MEC4050884.1 glycosyltransferase family 4 protein [Flavobacterium sp. SUN046]